nr:hypothetical protein [uncultured archaeon]
MPKVYNRITIGKYDRKKICQYDDSGELIKEWDSASQINNELGFDKSAILRCCKGAQKKSYWYVWKFKEEEETAPAISFIENENINILNHG